MKSVRLGRVAAGQEQASDGLVDAHAPVYTTHASRDPIHSSHATFRISTCDGARMCLSKKCSIDFRHAIATRSEQHSDFVGYRPTRTQSERCTMSSRPASTVVVWTVRKAASSILVGHTRSTLAPSVHRIPLIGSCPAGVSRRHDHGRRCQPSSARGVPSKRPSLLSSPACDRGPRRGTSPWPGGSTTPSSTHPPFSRSHSGYARCHLPGCVRVRPGTRRESRVTSTPSHP